MTPREVAAAAVRGRRPPYVPWSFRFTKEAAAALSSRLGTGDLPSACGNHFVELGNDVGVFEPVEGSLVRDAFGVVWDRSIDRDIGNVRGQVLPAPSLRGHAFPDPRDPRFFAGIRAAIAAAPDRFRLYNVGFSLFERAWTLRGLEPLLADIAEHPSFVRDLLETIADWNIAQVREALRYDVDAVLFGDDWGQQRGLLFGRRAWKALVEPPLRRMFRAVSEAGRLVFLHSCGDVDELFEDLVADGLSCFNPFQPEVMDVAGLLGAWRGRLSFWGGLSMQRTLPFGTPDEVRRESRRLLALGADGGYVFSPSHAVEGDTPVENMLAFIEEAKAQPGYREPRAG